MARLCERLTGGGKASFLPFGWMEMCDQCPEFFTCKKKENALYPKKKPSPVSSAEEKNAKEQERK